MAEAKEGACREQHFFSFVSYFLVLCYTERKRVEKWRKNSFDFDCRVQLWMRKKCAL